MVEFSIVGPLIALLNGLGILPKARDLVVRREQEAANKLAQVLGELEKNYAVILAEIKNFSGLSFNAKKSPRENLRLLDDFSPELTAARVQEARGHCKKIKRIYNTFLKAKLRELILEEESRQQMEKLFDQMIASDGHMDRAIESMQWLFREEVERLRSLIAAGNVAEANKFVALARVKLKTDREKAESSIAELRRLEAEYQEVAEAI